MNRLEFRNNIDKFKTLQHSSNNNKYYTKIDKYYSDGTPRYFYTKEEWDAYQEGVRKANYEKNKAAAENSEKDRWTRAKMNQANEEIKKKSTEAALNNLKLPASDVVKIKANEAADNKIKETEELAKKQQQEENYRKNKEAAEAKSKEEQERWKEIQRQNEREALVAKAKKHNEELKAKERKEKAEKTIANRDDAIKKAQQDYAKNNEAYLKNEERKKEREALAEKARKHNAELKAKEDLEKWKDSTKDKINDYALEVYDNVKRCSNDRGVSFDVDNPFVDLFKEALKKADPDFNGDIAAYVRPYPGYGLLGALGNNLAKDDKHTAIAKRVLNDLEDTLDDVINETTVNDEQYDDFLDHLKGKQEKNKNKAIVTEMSNAKKSLESMYNGDSERIELDDSLKKVLETKLKEIDPDYVSGSLYKYVRPYLFGKWIKDDKSYENVTKALDELEKELKTASKHDDVYGDFIEKVSKILT